MCDRDFNKKFGLFFIGLKEEMFYWEILTNNLRKIVVVSLSTFLTTTSISNKVINFIFKFLVNLINFPCLLTRLYSKALQSLS